MKDRHEHPSIATLCRQIDRKELILQPIFQRKYIWNPAQQRAFIKWVLEGKPIPSVIFSQFSGQRVVLDGQQRLTTIHRYRKGKFSVGNKYYNDLDEDAQEEFKDFNVAVQEFVLEDGDDDFDVISTFSVLNAGQQLSLGEKIYALETIYPVIKLTKDLFFKRYEAQESLMARRWQRWRDTFGEIKQDTRKKEYAVFVRLVISGLTCKSVPMTTEFEKMKKCIVVEIPNNDHSGLYACLDKFLALGEADETNYLKPKQLGILRLKYINAPWTTCALPETNSAIRQIIQRFGSVQEMWVRFFKVLSERSDVKDEWDKKINKKLPAQLKFVFATLT